MRSLTVFLILALGALGTLLGFILANRWGGLLIGAAIGLIAGLALGFLLRRIAAGVQSFMPLKNEL